MPFLVTRTKVILPRRRDDLLTRSRLIEQLNAVLDDKLVVISAPAGYGKTSFLVDFAHSAPLPVCWFSLDELDQDLQRFAAHFIASIAVQFPGFGAQANAALEALHQFPLNQFITILVNEIYEKIQEHFILILDDYHLVDEKKEINDFIGQFLLKVSENCHLFIASRKLLDIPIFSLLVSHSQAHGIGFEDLAFRPDEIQALLQQNYHLSIPLPDAENLGRESKGWITGLLLSAQTIWKRMASQMRAARTSDISLYDYLAVEVFEQQPVEMQDFLLRTAFFDEFDAILCRQVWGDEQNWPELIERIRKDNLFVLQVGEDGSWLRYHPLFRNFLQSRFKKIQPEEVTPLIHKMANVYIHRGEWERAHSILVTLGEVGALAALLDKAGPELLKCGRLGTIGNWSSAIPGNVLEQFPGVISLKGIVEVMQGYIDRGMLLLNHADAVQRSEGNYSGLALTLLRRTYGYRFQGKYQASLADAREALKYSEEYGITHLRAEALRVVGSNLYQLGQLEMAADSLNISLREYEKLGDLPNQFNVMLDLALVYSSIGQFSRALALNQQILEYYRSTHNITGLANLLNNLGALYQSQGDYQQSLACFEEGLLCAHRSGMVRMEAYILCGIGEVYDDLGAADGARKVFHQARDIATQINDRFITFYLFLCEAEQARIEGQLLEARHLLSEALMLADKSGSSYEAGLTRLQAGKQMFTEGQVSQAVQHLQKAAEMLETGGNHTDAAVAELYLAIASFHLGDEEAAVHALGRAFQRTVNENTRHALVLAGKEAQSLLEMAQRDISLAVRVEDLQDRIMSFQQARPGLRQKIRSMVQVGPYAPPRFEIFAFNNSLVIIDGKPVTEAKWIYQRRVRELFFFLLSRPEGATRDEICLTFWPDSPPSQLKFQFKNAIYRMRYALGEGTILLDQNYYRFNRSLDYVYDVERFQSYLNKAASTEDDLEKAGAYQSAVELYKGPFYPEAELTWVLDERERLQQSYLETLLNLGELSFRSGDYQAVIGSCNLAISVEPCTEEAYRLAMRVYAAMGDRAAVVRQYERCQSVLHEEAAVEPSQQTQELYQQLSK